MEPMVCVNCGYVYDSVNGDPQRGIEPGMTFDDLPEDWRCPVCYADKTAFDPY